MLTAIVETVAMVNRLKCESLDSLAMNKMTFNKIKSNELIHYHIQLRKTIVVT